MLCRLGDLPEGQGRGFVRGGLTWIARRIIGGGLGIAAAKAIST